MSSQERQRLRDSASLKKTKEPQQLNAMCDPKLNSGPGKNTWLSQSLGHLPKPEHRM